MVKNTKQSPRRIAYEALRRETGGAYANLALKEAMATSEAAVAPEDAAFAAALFYSALEHRITLDFYLSHLVKKRVPAPLRCILWLGAAQILYMNVPAHAAINESASLCKQIGKGSAAGFVNAVLRNLDRMRDDLPEPTGTQSERLSIRYSCPEWLVDRLLPLLGEEEAEAFLAESGAGSGVCIRANPLKWSDDELDGWLAEQKIDFIRGQWASEARYLRSAGDISKQSVFREGKITVQSESSMLVGRVLDARRGMKVLDCCAAPGGKTAYIAGMMGDGELLAWDNHAHRVRLIEQTCRRLGCDFVRAEEQDARVLQPELCDAWDRVLVDAPCSGLGVLRGKPDIKYRQTPEALVALVDIQRRILETCSQYVKPGGVLLYSTCTVMPEENQEQVEAFLSKHEEFALEDLNLVLPAAFDRERLDKKHLQLWPQRDGLDGFFIAKMRREETK